MLYGELIAVCSEIHTKHKTFMAKKLEFLKVESGGT